MKNKIILIIAILFLAGCAGMGGYDATQSKSATGLTPDYEAGDRFSPEDLNAMITAQDDTYARIALIEAITGLVYSNNDGTYTATTETGTGAFVRANSPTLVTPALGTPSAIDLTNATSLPAASITAGALADGMTATTQSVGDSSNKIATMEALANAALSLDDLDDLPLDDTDNNLVDWDIIEQAAANCRSSAPGTPYNGQLECADGNNWQPGGATDQGNDDWIVRYRTSDTTWVGIYNITEGAVIEKKRSLAVADLADATTPSVLTVSETTDTTISNYKSSGADHVFTMPAAHAGGACMFVVGDEFQVDVEPDSGANFVLNGTAMAADEHIQNTADTLYERIVCYVVNINGTLTWVCNSSDAAWVEATP